ncbi:glutaredoxin 3 [Gayadomonas joobiniege]|uniref:glutaredoxin 3 n=1 Tax=Gayadomonas joobiniege TaxID=1234606 RepID=UPI0003734012|nr:glutaredoxin 3 [Gayadomonas joobiniege]
MAKVTMYSKQWCPFCMRAKQLLKDKQVDFDEIDIGKHPELRDQMIQLSQRTTVPQVFINEHHVGGWDDLAAANASGELDKLLNT